MASDEPELEEVEQVTEEAQPKIEFDELLSRRLHERPAQRRWIASHRHTDARVSANLGVRGAHDTHMGMTCAFQSLKNAFSSSSTSTYSSTSSAFACTIQLRSSSMSLSGSPFRCRTMSASVSGS